MTTAIGGRIRCEIIQNAMSLLPRPRLKRRPMVWARITKTPSAAVAATTKGAPIAVAIKANARQPMNSPMIPKRGLYGSARGRRPPNEPRMSAMTALEVPTMTVFTYGRRVSLPSSTRM